jgi:hypothetical protein
MDRFSEISGAACGAVPNMTGSAGKLGSVGVPFGRVAVTIARPQSDLNRQHGIVIDDTGPS